MTHTSEPWHVEIGDLHVMSSSRKLIAGCGGHVDNFTPDLPAINRANAARIVACVNHCAGVDLSKVGPLASMLFELAEARDNVSALHAERDALRSALERFVSLCPSSEGLGGYAPIAAFGIAANYARAALDPKL